MASAASKVFISYARKDGAELAQRLLIDLKEHLLNPWLDKQRIRGGATWTKVIEDALDASNIVLALLTPGSYISEICRAEQIRALRKGKCVIPLLAQAGSDVPLHLEQKNYRDFSRSTAYAERFQELLADIREEKSVELKDEYRQTYVTAPPLPVNFVERPEALEALRNVLITDDGGRHISLTALEGMGGIGKTVLAQALCHDPVVQQAFPDGVVWITIGKESAFDVVTRMREAGKGLNDDLTRYDNELGCMNQYRTTVRNKTALIVLDDVWNPRDIEPFRAESPCSRLLFTTRDSSIAAAVGAQEHLAELLTEEQSRTVLAQWSAVREEKLPVQAGDLIRECGRLPLALAMIGAMLRGKPAAFWQQVLKLLRVADLKKIKAQFPDYPHTDLLRAIQISVDALHENDAEARKRYLALAVILEDMPVHPLVQQTLWGADELAAAETAEQLIGLSLAQREGGEGAIKLHDLQLDYVRAQFPDKEALELIHSALRLSNVVLKAPTQFASQMVGRLLVHREPRAVGSFVAHIAAAAPCPWLRPLWPALHPPGTALIRSLEGHSDSVFGVTVTPDGRHAVSASADKTLGLWCLESGRKELTLAGHTDSVYSVAVTNDGRRAVSASYDKTLKVWVLESGREECTLVGHSGSVHGVALTPDGRRAVSASDDNTLKVWDLESCRELHSLKGHSSSIYGVAVTPDGLLAVSASLDNTLKVWNLENGRELRSLVGHSSAVSSVAITLDSSRAISASWDNTLKIWDLESGRELHSLEGHSSRVIGVAVTPDGRRAVSASWDNTLKVWDLESGRELCSLEGHSSAINGVAVTPDGRRVVSASSDKALKIWNLESKREGRLLSGQTGSVREVALTLDPRVIPASRDNTLKICDLETGRELRLLPGHAGSVRSVAVTPDRQRAISASWDNTLKIFDLENGRVVHTLAGHTRSVMGVTVTPDGQRTVSASVDNTLKVWALESGVEQYTLTGHSDSVRGVAVTPDGRYIVSASCDSTLKVWDLESGREVRTLQGHFGYVVGVAVTPDGQHIVSASCDDTLKVWDLESGHERHTLAGHSDSVRGVAVTPDGRHIVSASCDNTLKVWNLEGGHEVCCLQGHSGYVVGVAVTPDGRHIISGSWDNTLKVWDLDTGKCLATFTGDSAVFCCDCVDAQTILAGDEAGRIHLLRLEE
jgi:WD40 repeat protein